jgi:hypothetical protein
MTGKIEAGYRLPLGFHVTGGADYDLKERNVPYYCGTSGCGSLASVTTRAETDETTYRLQLRRSLAETVNGALSYAHSNRGGTDLLTNVTFINGNPGVNLVAPLHLADRERDLWRLMADWTPIESLSFQFTAEDAKDEYSGRRYGLRSGDMQNYSVDAAYTFSEAWKATAWVSHNDTLAQQASCDSTQTTLCPNTATDPNWSADLRSIGNAAGVGVRSKPKTWLEIGADLQHTRDHAEYVINAVMPPGVTPPPDSQYRQTRLKLFARYEIQKNMGARVDYAYERWEIDDWTWATWTYPSATDGTRVLQGPVQKVHFFGISGYYRWW